MAYTKTNWVNGITPLNDKNMNKIENALENLDTNMNKIENELSDLDSNKINFSYLTDFADGIARKRRVESVDFNSLAAFQSGLITILHATANAPANMGNISHWHVLQIYTKEDGNYEYITQIATYFFDYADTNIYIRKCEGGTWGAWRKIATSAV